MSKGKCQNWCDKTLSLQPTLASKYFIYPVQAAQHDVKYFHLMVVNYKTAPSFPETLGEI